MNTEFETNELPDAPQGEPSLIASIKKIQKHLVFLEKKIEESLNIIFGLFCPNQLHQVAFLAFDRSVLSFRFIWTCVTCSPVSKKCCNLA